MGREVQHRLYSEDRVNARLQETGPWRTHYSETLDVLRVFGRLEVLPSKQNSRGGTQMCPSSAVLLTNRYSSFP